MYERVTNMYLPLIILMMGLTASQKAQQRNQTKVLSQNQTPLGTEETIQVIVECSMDEKKEEYIQQVGKVIYKLPALDAYVIEIPLRHKNKLRGIDGLRALHDNTRITAQMNVARRVVGADYAQTRGYSGKGVGVAILDTGICPLADFTNPYNRIIGFKDFVHNRSTPYDDNGHGTHVAGIVGGNGTLSQGKYTGIAPGCNLIGVKILDERGSGNTSTVLAGIQWVIDNKNRYNIRVANLSIGSSEAKERDPLIKAVNAAWDAGIVITVAAGNNGPNPHTITSPGNSRKVITVGASDDHNSVSIWGDTLVNFSGRGPTFECIKKPDVIAPGANIISCLTTTPYQGKKDKDGPKLIDQHYQELSGTSMSTPIVAGAIALLLEKNAHLTPNDVKLLLHGSTNDLRYPQNQQGWGLLDIEKLMNKE